MTPLQAWILGTLGGLLVGFFLGLRYSYYVWQKKQRAFKEAFERKAPGWTLTQRYLTPEEMDFTDYSPPRHTTFLIIPPKRTNREWH